MKKPSPWSRIIPRSRNDIIARWSERIFGQAANVSVFSAAHGRLGVAVHFREKQRSFPGPNWFAALARARAVTLLNLPANLCRGDVPMFEYTVSAESIVLTDRACSFELTPSGESGERAVGVISHVLVGRNPYEEIPEVAAVSLVMDNDLVQLRTNPSECRRVTRLSTQEEPSS